MSPLRPMRNTEASRGSVVQYPGSCTAVIGSMTLALKAQQALATASIRSSVTKVSSSQSHRGCAYGIIYPCIQHNNVMHILSTAGIHIRQLLGEAST